MITAITWDLPMGTVRFDNDQEVDFVVHEDTSGRGARFISFDARGGDVGEWRLLRDHMGELIDAYDAEVAGERLYEDLASEQRGPLHEVEGWQ